MQSFSVIRDSNKLEWLIKPSFGNMKCGEMPWQGCTVLLSPGKDVPLSKTFRTAFGRLLPEPKGAAS